MPKANPQIRLISRGVVDTSDIKRCYVPGLEAALDCPECGSVIVHEFESEYMSYPSAGGVTTLYFYCPMCEGEFEVDAVFRNEAWLEPVEPDDS